MASLDSFKCRKKLDGRRQELHYFRLKTAEKNGLKGISALPYLDEGAARKPAAFRGRPLRHQGRHQAVADWLDNQGKTEREIAFRPARVLMQDFTGVPAVVDLAAMRDAMTKLGGDPQKINPLVPVDLVIDHSVMSMSSARRKPSSRTSISNIERNGERYSS